MMIVYASTADDSRLNKFMSQTKVIFSLNKSNANIYTIEQFSPYNS